MGTPLAITRDAASAALIDRRVIAFRPAALVAAMQRAGRQFGMLAEEEVMEVRTLPARQAVAFALAKDGQVRERVVAGAELVALLISYCIGAGVPLPSRAEKTIEVAPGGVTLDFVITFAAPPRAVRGGSWGALAPVSQTTRA